MKTTTPIKTIFTTWQSVLYACAAGLIEWIDSDSRIINYCVFGEIRKSGGKTICVGCLAAACISHKLNATDMEVATHKEIQNNNESPYLRHLYSGIADKYGIDRKEMNEFAHCIDGLRHGNIQPLLDIYMPDNEVFRGICRAFKSDKDSKINPRAVMSNPSKQEITEYATFLRDFADRYPTITQQQPRG